ncbi:hypothetical protein HK101_000376, partial [Irineochytrium annulatum]
TTRRTKNRYNISFKNAHHLVTENWDKSLTLRQNYERLGLVSSLNGKAGGEAEQEVVRPDDEAQGEGTVEYRTMEEFERMDSVTRTTDMPADDDEDGEEEDEPFHHILTPSERVHGINPPITTDARTTHIGLPPSHSRPTSTPAPTASTKRRAPPTATSVADAMRAEADMGEAPRLRWASEGEGRVMEALRKRYGEDYAKMSRDRKLNQYQLTEGQLRRRFERAVKVGVKVMERVEVA